MLIGLGHDLQAVAEIASTEALREPGVFFTADEIFYAEKSPSALESLAAAFSSKEALYKALPPLAGWFWTDAEVSRDARNAPVFRLHGALREALEHRRWRVFLSVSHSGGFVSTVVVVADGATS